MTTADGIPVALLPPPINTEPVVDMRSALASEWVRDKLLTIATTSRRSLQAEAGASEIGQSCPRRLAYRIAGTPIVNIPDPTKALIGTGFHAVVADGLARLDQGSQRYLIEQRVAYRGISGSVDLHDRWCARMFDWKTSDVRRISKYRRDGISSNYLVQSLIYAEGLIAMGERVETISITFVPRDGTLADVWSFTTVRDKARADLAVDRYESIRARVADEGVASIAAQPSALCTYCPNYRAGASDLALACPGKDE